MKGWGKLVESKAEWYKFAIHVAKGRWTSMFAAFLIMATSGGPLLFSLFSSQIIRNLGYTDSMMSTLNTWNEIGASTGILAGLVAEVTPTRLVLGISSFTNFFGYFMIWLAVIGKVSRPEVWLMCLYMFIGAGSQNLSTTASVVASVKNFPERRSMIFGLLDGYAGLSIPIFTQISAALFGDNSTSLILLAAWLPALISLLFMHTIGEKKVTIRQLHEPKVFYHFLFLSAIPAAYLMAITLARQYLAFSRAADAGSAIVLCVFLFLPVVVAYKQEVLLWKQMNAPPIAIIIDSPQAVEEEHNSSTNQVEAEVEEEIISVEQEQNSSKIIVEEEIVSVEQEENFSEEAQRSFFAAIFKKPKRGEDYGILQAIVSTDMLIILLAAGVGLGSLLTTLANMSQIGKSLQYDPNMVILFIPLVNRCNYVGRVSCGFISEKLVVKFKAPRPLMLAAVLFVSSIGLLLIAFPFKISLYLALVIIGFRLGALLPLVLAIISDIFGLKYYSTLFNCGQLTSPAGLFLLNQQLTKRLYHIEATKLHGMEGMGKSWDCEGKQCFGLSFMIMAIATFFGGILSVILATRTLEFYKADIHRRYRAGEEEIEVALSSVATSLQ